MSIGVFNEGHVHATLKQHYAQPGDVLEAPIAPYVVDILRGDLVDRGQLRAAPVAEGRARRRGDTAARAGELEPRAAPVAEGRAGRRRGAAAWTGHSLILQPTQMCALKALEAEVDVANLQGNADAPIPRLSRA